MIALYQQLVVRNFLVLQALLHFLTSNDYVRHFLERLSLSRKHAVIIAFPAVEILRQLLDTVRQAQSSL